MLTIYRFPTLYRLAMRVGYGADSEARYPLVADLVADQTGQPSHILELCCGDLALYRHLLRRGLARSYLGLEQSPADTVIMQASLYQFHDIADTLLPRLWTAARRLLVIAEPVRNLSQSRYGAAHWAARILTRTDDRVHIFRYTEATLLELYQRCKIPVSRLDRTPGGREIVVCSFKAPSLSTGP